MGGILLLSPVGHRTPASRDAQSATWVLLRAPLIALPLPWGLSCCPGAMGASAPAVEVAPWHGGHADVSQAVLTSTKCLL